MKRRKLLIVDDTPAIREFLLQALTSGYEIVETSRPTTARQILDEGGVDCLIVDVTAAGTDGDAMIQSIGRGHDAPAILAIKDRGVNASARLVQSGVYDFIEKPFTVDRLIHTIERAMEYKRLQRENALLACRARSNDSVAGLIGHSDAAVDLREKVRVLAGTESLHPVVEAALVSVFTPPRTRSNSAPLIGNAPLSSAFTTTTVAPGANLSLDPESRAPFAPETSLTLGDPTRGSSGNFNDLAAAAAASPSADDLQTFMRDLQAELRESPGSAYRRTATAYRPFPRETIDANLAILRLLLDAGGDPNAVDTSKNSTTPLSMAVLGRDGRGVRLLLEHGADPNKSFQGFTPLGAATMMQNHEAVRLLLDAGAKPLGKSEAGGVTAFFVAACEGYEEFFQLMVDRIDLASVPSEMQGRLLLAATASPSSLEKVLASGVDVNATNQNSYTALRFAVTENNLEAIPLLLAAGAETAAAAPDGSTALHFTANEDNLEAARLLLEAGASPNVRDDSGYTPLHNAAERAHHRIVALLLEHGAEIDAITTDKYGQSPLQAGAWAGAFESVKLLLKAGAEVDRVSTDGVTALLNAAGGGYPEIVAFLADQGADVNKHARRTGHSVLHKAAGARARARHDSLEADNDFEHLAGDFGTDADYLAVVEFCLERGAEVDARDSDGGTPLMTAAWYNQFAIARLLLEKGADIHAIGDHHGVTAMATTIEFASPEMLSFLLDKGASLGPLGNQKATPLHIAAMKNRPDMIRILLGRGAALEARTTPGTTPLLEAVNNNALGAARVLLEHGANPKIAPRPGQDALSLAIEKGNDAMIRLLSSHRK